MSRTSLVLTVLGEDRPGLVDAIAQVVVDHGGNWIESRMAHLAGQFAGILRVEVDADKADALKEAINQLGNQPGGGGLESVVHADVVGAAPSENPVVQLSLVGQDRPGIVREISQVLVAHGVNVEELSTACKRAPNSGQELFEATAQLRLPAGMSAEALSAALEQVASDMMVDVRVE